LLKKSWHEFRGRNIQSHRQHKSREYNIGIKRLNRTLPKLSWADTVGFKRVLKNALSSLIKKVPDARRARNPRAEAYLGYVGASGSSGMPQMGLFQQAVKAIPASLMVLFSDGNSIRAATRSFFRLWARFSK
jgi:hypothetical protein